MKILLTGDWHGDQHAARFSIQRALDEKCDLIVQLGDFGIWTHEKWGQTFLETVNHEAKRVPIFFLDGNHENFADLRRMARPSAPPFQELVPFWGEHPKPFENLFHIPRGARWTWAGVSFLGLGGAASIDKTWRLQMERGQVPRTAWWWEELITDEDEERAKQGGPVDIFLAHDAPFNDLHKSMGLPSLDDFKMDIISLRNRERVRAVVDHTKPVLMYHGHYHTRYSHVYEGEGFRTTVEGLHHDGNLSLMTDILDLGWARDYIEAEHAARSLFD